MSASDFARWAGPRAAHIQNVVTTVTMVTTGQDPTIPATFEQGAAVTTVAGVMVTAVTETKPTFASVIPVCPEAGVPEESIEDQCGNRDHRGDDAIEREATACREERAAIVEYDSGAVHKSTPSEPALLAPGIWFDRFGPTGEPPFDQPCVSRRGRVERQGGAFLHFCVTCGAWGAFGYGVTGGRPGRWYCGQHRPKDEM